MPQTDNSNLTDLFASRRYFRKFEAILLHMARVAGVMEVEGQLRRDEVNILTRYASALNFTFRALSYKYLLVGRDTGRYFGSLNIDTRESGFPASDEILSMANDAQQAERHLAQMPSEADLKSQMVGVILGERKSRPSCNSRCHNASITKNCCAVICSGRAMIPKQFGKATTTSAVNS